MHCIVKDRQGYALGRVESLPNGRFYYFHYATKMQGSKATYREAMLALAPYRIERG